MSSELPTAPGLDEVSTPAQPERPPPKHIFEGHANEIYSFVFLHDNVHIVSGSLDGTMRKWDCETGLLVGGPWKGEGGDIYALALSPDGKMIACSRGDGSLQRWNTDGEMSEGFWTGHGDLVGTISWSPNGDHIASGSSNGTILIRNAENGKVEVGPIEAGQGWFVKTVAYSPSEDRIASGGFSGTICIWDGNTGELLVSPIKDVGEQVISVVWSSDSSKLYSASYNFARVFDSVSGTELHRFKHDHFVTSVALSPKHNVLACVDFGGIAQLWDTESYQPLGKPFGPEDISYLLRCVSFSQDGRYLAYSGHDNKITLWMVKDIAAHLTDVTQQKIPPESPSSSCIEVSALTYFTFRLLTEPCQVDATNPFGRPRGDNMMEEGHDNPYGDFFHVRIVFYNAKATT